MSSAAFPPATWRLLPSADADGATNMALDAAIAAAVAARRVPPTVRFYGWSPPCLSLGVAQPWSDVDALRLQRRGWDVVRRPTGGRAILHTDELTYLLCIPDDDPRVAGTVRDSYRRLSAALVLGLTRLELAADRAAPPPGPSGHPPGPVCFDTPSAYEITAGGRKLIGSAQRRQRGVVLQHGTLPLTGDITRICDALRTDDRPALRAHVRARATTLQSALGGQKPAFDTVADALAAGLAEALAVTLVPGALTVAERSAADALRRSQFTAAAWTQRVP